MEFFETAHEIAIFGIRRVPGGMILLGCPDDEIDHIGKTAAATAALFHGVINLCRHDELPTVFVEKSVDRVLDLLLGDEIATANQHDVLPVFAPTLM
jgi:hypothetical protein